jgi:hypothetical protein
MPRLSLLCATTLGLGLLAAGGVGAREQAPAAVPERLVTSALVYNVAKLTEWPAEALGSAATPVTLCLLRERETYQGIFVSIEGKSVKGRTLAISEAVKLSQLEACHLLYLDEFDEPRLPAVLQTLRGRPVLTVGAFDGFAESGGMVGLFLEHNQMQFRINRRAVAQARLALSAQLLRMAQIVNGGAP